jgi:hypothetical protein
VKQAATCSQEELPVKPARLDVGMRGQSEEGCVLFVLLCSPGRFWVSARRGDLLRQLVSFFELGERRKCYWNVKLLNVDVVSGSDSQRMLDLLCKFRVPLGIKIEDKGKQKQLRKKT